MSFETEFLELVQEHTFEGVRGVTAETVDAVVRSLHAEMKRSICPRARVTQLVEKSCYRRKGERLWRFRFEAWGSLGRREVS